MHSGARHLELGRVREITLRMLQDVGPALRQRDIDRMDDIAQRGDDAGILEEEILHQLSKLRMRLPNELESAEFQQLKVVTDNSENLADVIETDMAALVHQPVNRKSSSKANP